MCRNQLLNVLFETCSLSTITLYDQPCRLNFSALTIIEYFIVPNILYEFEFESVLSFKIRH